MAEQSELPAAAAVADWAERRGPAKLRHLEGEWEPEEREDR